MVDLPPHHGKELWGLGSVIIRTQQCVKRIADRGQRISQLVAENGQELVFLATRFTQGFFGLHPIEDVADLTRKQVQKLQSMFAGAVRPPVLLRPAGRG